MSARVTIGDLRLEALGTAWHLRTDAAPPRVTSVAEAVLDAFDRTWSRFRADSEVTALARTGGRIALDADTQAMFDLYRRLTDLTGGAVSPLVGGSLAALGYDADYTLQAGVPAPAPDSDILRILNGDLVLDAPATVDIGALGKGLAVDLVVAALQAEQIVVDRVDASGDLWHGGEATLRVALEDPHDPTKAIGVARLVPGTAIAASAVNRRTWGEGLHHVLDARTGLPVAEVTATWAIAESAMLADAAATALFFTSAQAVAQALDVVAVRMFDHRVVEIGGAFDGEIFR